MNRYNKDGGHGITGSKNIYCSKTNIGNWVEDHIGQDLVSNPRQATTLYETSSMNEYIDPSLQTVRSGPNHAKFANSVRYLSKSELKAKNKEGLSYTLLFQHGLHEEDISPGERYNSQLSLSYSQSKLEVSGGDEGLHASTPPPVAVQKQREKLKEIRKQLDLSFKRGTSEANSANAYASHSDAIAPRSIAGPSADLPNVARRVVITGQFSPIKYR